MKMNSSQGKKNTNGFKHMKVIELSQNKISANNSCYFSSVKMLMNKNLVRI